MWHFYQRGSIFPQFFFLTDNRVLPSLVTVQQLILTLSGKQYHMNTARSPIWQAASMVSIHQCSYVWVSILYEQVPHSAGHPVHHAVLLYREIMNIPQRLMTCLYKVLQQQNSIKPLITETESVSEIVVYLTHQPEKILLNCQNHFK